jgi:outer membrane lipoprotein SlyB
VAGGGSGAAVGAAVGAGTGAVVGSQRSQRHHYYWRNGRCWARQSNGMSRQVASHRCHR